MEKMGKLKATPVSDSDYNYEHINNLDVSTIKYLSVTYLLYKKFQNGWGKV